MKHWLAVAGLLSCLLAAPCPALDTCPPDAGIADQLAVTAGPAAGNLTALVSGYCPYVGLPVKEGPDLFVPLKDGTRLRYDDGRVKTFEQKLEAADLEDMFSQPYAPGPVTGEVPEDFDPGRIRVEALFHAVYGGSEAAVRKNMVRVDFCGQKVSFNTENGAAKALSAVGGELAALLARRPDLKPWVFPLGGTFNWRVVAGTSRLSPHSWAAAIDLNPKKGAYWRWGKKTPAEATALRREYPFEIVEIFERHGFVWGGKWFHFDLMHFEYRPEFFSHFTPEP